MYYGVLILYIIVPTRSAGHVSRGIKSRQDGHESVSRLSNFELPNCYIKVSNWPGAQN